MSRDWRCRTINGGDWQVYEPGLLHIATIERAIVRSPEKRERLARLICLSVNNHDALVEALHQAANALSLADDTGRKAESRNIDALLAKIEKEAKP